MTKVEKRFHAANADLLVYRHVVYQRNSENHQFNVDRVCKFVNDVHDVIASGGADANARLDGLLVMFIYRAPSLRVSLEDPIKPLNKYKEAPRVPAAFAADLVNSILAFVRAAKRAAQRLAM
jgi:hypothetical protein